MFLNIKWQNWLNLNNIFVPFFFFLHYYCGQMALTEQVLLEKKLQSGTDMVDSQSLAVYD